jgi:hypothetical protein
MNASQVFPDFMIPDRKHNATLTHQRSSYEDAAQFAQMAPRYNTIDRLELLQTVGSSIPASFANVTVSTVWHRKR